MIKKVNNTLWEVKPAGFPIVTSVKCAEAISNCNESRGENVVCCPHLHTFVDFYAFFLLIPFRLQINKKSNEYVIVSSKFRKIFVAILVVMHLILGSVSVSRIFNTFYERPDITTAFYLASNIFTLAAFASIVKAFQLDQDRICQLINHCRVENQYAATKKARCLVLFICLFVVCTTASQELLSSQGVADKNHIFHLVTLIFISPIVKLTGVNPLHLLGSMFSDAILSNIGGAILCFHFAMLNVLLPFMLTLSLTMNSMASRGFIKNIEKKSYGNVTMVLEHYAKMRKATNIVGELFGNFVLTFYICALTFFSEIPQIILAQDAADGLIRIFLTAYICIISVSMYQAANFNEKVDTCLRTFISFHHWQDDLGSKQRLQLIALTQEIDAKPLGISCCFFTITKTFLGSSIGLVVTYSLIVFQLVDKERQVFWQA